MGRQTKPRKSENNVVGKGKVTPIQVAFIVDQYLADNNFAHTRSVFQSEAASLLAKSRASQAPKGLMTLGALLNEYVCLKEQKLMMDESAFQLEQHKAMVDTAKSRLEKEKAIVDEVKCQLQQEKAKVDSLLEGFQGLIHDYKSPPSNRSIVSSAPSKSKDLPHPDNNAIQTPITAPASIVPHHNTKKRKSYDAADNPEPTKKPCGSSSTSLSTSPGNISTGQQQDENLFSRSSFESPNTNTSCLKTPQGSVSYSSGKSISPPEDTSSSVKSSLVSLSSETTPNNCSIYSSQTIIVSSPTKRFSIERKHCTYKSPGKSNMNKRDHVKSRLDFDTVDLPITSEKLSLDVCTTSEADMDGDIFDIDLDALGPDFSLSDLLNDFGIEWEVGHPCQDAMGASPSGPCEGDLCVSQELEQSKPKGSDPVASVKSITVHTGC